MKLIFCDHWAPAPEGWIILKESDQDITKPFPWDDNSVDRAFSCHGFEHVDLIGGITYLKEVYRVLKPGGIIRTVCPFLGDMIRTVRAVKSPALYRDYFKNSIAPHYSKEIQELEKLGLDPYVAFPQLFFDSLIKNHNHKMVWEADILGLVLKKVGFSQINICLPGESAWDESMCLERRFRGVDTALAESHGYKTFDPEGSVVEAQK